MVSEPFILNERFRSDSGKQHRLPISHHPWKWSKDAWMWHLGNGLVVNTAVLGEWLDLVMLKVFSILNNPMILTTHLRSV